MGAGDEEQMVVTGKGGGATGTGRTMAEPWYEKTLSFEETTEIRAVTRARACGRASSFPSERLSGQQFVRLDILRSRPGDHVGGQGRGGTILVPVLSGEPVAHKLLIK